MSGRKPSLNDFAMYLTRGAGGARKLFVGGNWKMNGTKSKAAGILETLNNADPVALSVDVVVAVNDLHIGLVQGSLRGDYAVAAQNCSVTPGFGACTGETSVDMLVDLGVNWVIVGHSERRAGFGGLEGETDEVVATKVKVALDAGLSVIACIGEKLEDREGGNTLEVVLNQNLAAISAVLSAADWANVVIAYEPVWAIGTGLTATPEQAQEVHAAIRSWLKENVSEAVSEATRVIYGGSVKAANAADLISETDIDGFLVGGASLKPEFVDIIDTVGKSV